MLACFTSAASVDERGRRPAVPSAVDPRHAVGYSFEQDRRSHTSGEVQARLWLKLNLSIPGAALGRRGARVQHVHVVDRAARGRTLSLEP